MSALAQYLAAVGNQKRFEVLYLDTRYPDAKALASWAAGVVEKFHGLALYEREELPRQQREARLPYSEER